MVDAQMFSNVLIPTNASAVIRLFPWTNGIANVPDKRSFLETAIRAMEKKPEKGVTDLIMVCSISGFDWQWSHILLQKLAEQVESMAALEVHDPNKQYHIVKYLALNQPLWTLEDSRNAVLTFSERNQPSHVNSLAVAHIIFWYKLLDVPADALGVLRQSGLALITRVASPRPCRERMKDVRDQYHGTAFPDPGFVRF